MKEISEKKTNSLEEIREAIDTIDKQIVSLLAKRHDQVRDIVTLKKANNIPVYHPAREEDLISARRRQAEQIGLDSDYIEGLYRLILRRSRAEQSEHMTQKCVRPGAKVLIVGGKGEMGRYFENCFSKAGYQVRLMGRGDWSNVSDICDGVDLVIISVPIHMTLNVIKRMGPYLPKDAVLTDITSVKKGPLKTMLKTHGGPVLGLHPLFGPSTSTLNKQIVVATPGRDSAACQWVLDQFSIWGSIIVMSNADEHDEIMAVVQALRHFATFSFGQFLSRRNIEMARTLEFSSPIYRLELGMVGRLFDQDASLYAEIIFASPERLALLKEYIASLNRNIEMLENMDKAGFIEEFNRIAEWFDPFSEQAMRESSFLIDKLIERFS